MPRCCEPVMAKFLSPADPEISGLRVEKLVAPALRPPEPQPDTIHLDVRRIGRRRNFRIGALGTRQINHRLPPLEVTRLLDFHSVHTGLPTPWVTHYRSRRGRHACQSMRSFVSRAHRRCEPGAPDRSFSASVPAAAAVS